jgi:hypothetical protein
LDETRKNELGEKLVSHSKGPMQSTVEFNHYVVNGMMFLTIGHDNGKRTYNSGVCVTTIDGPTYYGKLVRILEVQYYDGTRYVLFKCDWADIRKDRGYKEDEYGFQLVNFKKLIHTGERIIDDPFVLSSQVSQVYYVEDDRHLDWVVAVKTKTRHVYNVCLGEGHDDDPGNYKEIEPFNLDVNHDVDVTNENIEGARTGVPTTIVHFEKSIRCVC